MFYYQTWLMLRCCSILLGVMLPVIGWVPIIVAFVLWAIIINYRSAKSPPAVLTSFPPATAIGIARHSLCHSIGAGIGERQSRLKDFAARNYKCESDEKKQPVWEIYSFNETDAFMMHCRRAGMKLSVRCEQKVSRYVHTKVILSFELKLLRWLLEPDYRQIVAKTTGAIRGDFWSLRPSDASRLEGASQCGPTIGALNGDSTEYSTSIDDVEMGAEELVVAICEFASSFRLETNRQRDGAAVTVELCSEHGLHAIVRVEPLGDGRSSRMDVYVKNKNPLSAENKYFEDLIVDELHRISQEAWMQLARAERAQQAGGC